MQAAHDPGELVVARSRVVEQAHRVALGVAELGDVLVGEEVLVHPLEPLRIAEARDRLVVRRRPLDDERHQR
jgi:hypothetical protein